MTDSTYIKVHRTACSLRKGGGVSRHIGRTKNGLNSKIHTMTDERGRPPSLCLTAGQVSDHVSAKILYEGLPRTQDVIMIADKGYGSDECRKALMAKGITPCIPPRKGPPKGDAPPHSSVKQHINNDIRSKICLQGSRIGAELRSVMTDARAPSLLLSSSRPSLHTGCNES